LTIKPLLSWGHANEVAAFESLWTKPAMQQLTELVVRSPFFYDAIPRVAAQHLPQLRILGLLAEEYNGTQREIDEKRWCPVAQLPNDWLLPLHSMPALTELRRSFKRALPAPLHELSIIAGCGWLQPLALHSTQLTAASLSALFHPSGSLAHSLCSLTLVELALKFDAASVSTASASLNGAELEASKEGISADVAVASGAPSGVSAALAEWSTAFACLSALVSLRLVQVAAPQGIDMLLESSAQAPRLGFLRIEMPLPDKRLGAATGAASSSGSASSAAAPLVASSASIPALMSLLQVRPHLECELVSLPAAEGTMFPPLRQRIDNHRWLLAAQRLCATAPPTIRRRCFLVTSESCPTEK